MTRRESATMAVLALVAAVAVAVTACTPFGPGPCWPGAAVTYDVARDLRAIGWTARPDDGAERIYSPAPFGCWADVLEDGPDTGRKGGI